jgi:hypothetical protein
MKATIVHLRYMKATFVPPDASKATFMYLGDTKATFMYLPAGGPGDDSKATLLTPGRR